MKNLLKVILSAVIFTLIFPVHSATSRNNNSSNIAQTTVVSIPSENTQPVGLIGAEVKATIVLYKKNYSSKSSKSGFIEFDSNVLVNSYGRKGCVATQCLIEVKFDNGQTIKYKIYESNQENYLRRVFLNDYRFNERLLNSKNITLKIRFADLIDGVYIFKTSSKIRE